MILTIVTIVVLSFVGVFVLDDLILDLVSLFKGLGPRELTAVEIEELQKQKQKNIAIIVANWHEAEIIGRMVAGNKQQILYSNYHFFLGVYPNDVETVEVAKNAAQRFAGVHVVINSRPGPTSKGQMLNELVRGVFAKEETLGIKFDVFLMQDSEDILHPLALGVINREIETCDFLQTPVFSMDRSITQLVGGIYIDEFAEIHTKDLFARQAMGAAVPSAGVGTAIHRRLMNKLMETSGGNFLREDALTEDYVLGMSSGMIGFRTAYCCYYRRLNGRRDYIATREYFPSQFQASVRQKSRWITGIVFQGARMIPWQGSWANRYFLYRDRRGPLNSIGALACTTLAVYLLFRFLVTKTTPDFLHTTWFIVGSLIATGGAFNRLIHRIVAVARVNSLASLLTIPIRWPIANLINTLATLRAIRDIHRAHISGEPLRWVKTTHELPQNFGEP